MSESVAGGRWSADADIYLPGYRGGVARGQTPIVHMLAIDAPAPRRRSFMPASLEEQRYGIPETAFPPDDRRIVENTRAFPYSAICGLSILNVRQQLFYGTGFLVGPRLVVTAGHNVHFADEGFMQQITVYPGLNGDRQAPPFRFARATQFFTVEAWARDQDRQFDIGAIVLPTDLGTEAGWFAVGKFAEGTLAGKIATISGYPKLAPEPAAQQASMMWEHAGVLSVEPNRLRYGIDTTEGQSGSPVIVNLPQKPIPYHAVGIHNWGYDSYNAATRINDAIFAQIVRWRQFSDSATRGGSP